LKAWLITPCLCLTLLACAPPKPAESPPATRSALTFPPTPQGVDAPVFGPARNASRPQAAFDGETFLVVWEDRRAPRSDVFAARFSAAGTVLDPENIMLPVSTATSERFEPSVGFGGGVFLVVWEERISSTLSPDVRGVRVGRDGRPVGAVFFVSRSSCGDCNKPRVAFDGTNFAVVWQRGITSSGQVEGARISTAGVLIDTTPKYLAQARNNSTLGTNAAITYANGRYILAWLDQTSIFAARLMPDLTRLDTTGIEIAQGANSDGAAIAAGGDQVWIGWSATGSTEQLVRRIGRDDAVPIGNAVSVAPVTSDPYSFPAALGFDGNSLAVVYEQGPGEGEDLLGTLVDAGGAIVAPAVRPLITADKGQFLPSLAGGGADPLLLTWMDTRLGGSAVYGTRVGGGASLDGQGKLISNAVNHQTDPAVTGNAGGFFVAWTDSRDGGSHAYGAALDAQGAPLRPTAVPLGVGPLGRADVALASDGSQYLAVWTQNDFSGTFVAGGRLIGADGTPLGSPAVFAANLRQPAVAYGNDVYLVIGNRSSGNALDGVRVSRTGQVMDATPLSIATDGYRPAVASDGQQFLAVWRGGEAVAGVRVTAAGQVMDATPLQLAPAGSRASYYPKVAFGASVYLIVWDSSSPSGVLAARVGTDGVPIDTTPISIALQRTVTTNPISLETPRFPAVSFDGNRFVVTWESTVTNSSGNTTTRDIRFARVTAAGVVEGSAVVAARDDSSPFSDSTPVGGGGAGRSVVVYTQYDRPAGYDVPRVRVRLFADQKPPVGGSCASTADCAAGTCVDGVCCETACAGGPLDCHACSVVGGAARNGTCSVVPDGRACGVRGTCGAGICNEPPDAGPPDAGGMDVRPPDATTADRADDAPTTDARDAPDAGPMDTPPADVPPVDAPATDAPRPDAPVADAEPPADAQDVGANDRPPGTDAGSDVQPDGPPSGADAGQTPPPGGCGCAVTQTPGGPMLAGQIAAIALALVLGRTRCRRSRPV